MYDNDPAASSWHIDRRIPIAIIATLFITFATQTGAIIWWASGMSYRMDTVERTLQIAAPQADRLTRVEVRIEAIQEGVRRIEGMIRRSPTAQ